jgi:hypothetical protein
MGEIASHGGPEAAVKLFRDPAGRLVLCAWDLFPPKLIDVEVADGACGVVRHQEMHVDGGVAAPLFLMPDALLHWRNLGPPLPARSGAT